MLKQISLFCGVLGVGIQLVSAANVYASSNTITLNATVQTKCTVAFSTNELTWSLDTDATNESMESDQREVQIEFIGCPDGNSTPISFVSSEVSDDDCARVPSAGSNKLEDQQPYIQYCFKDDIGDRLQVVEASKREKNLKSSLNSLRDEKTKSIFIFPQRDGKDTPLSEGRYTGYVTVATNIE